MIFSRGRGSGRHARGDQPRGGGRSGAGPQDTEAQPAPEPQVTGPYDSSEAPEGVQRLDLGSLWLPAIEGVEVRVQADPDGTIGQVVLVHGPNALQLGVFAAPRTEGIWHEVREEIRESLVADGAAPQEIPGEYGMELRARVRTPDGQTDLRFVGVDGPRWMVRGVFQGPAAMEPEASTPLVECLHGLVVNRGQEAKPVREPLPLRLPKQMTDPGGEQGEPGGQ